MQQPRISSYLTTWNAITHGRPLESVLAACLEFSQELVVADASSDDGTWDLVMAAARRDPRIRPLRFAIDRTRPYWALQTILHLRATARAACRGSHCFEARVDELPVAASRERMVELAQSLRPEAPLLALPNLALWGRQGLVRAAACHAPRLSLNLHTLTHTLPAGQDAVDANGYPQAQANATLDALMVDERQRQIVPFKTLLPIGLDELREHPAHPDLYASQLRSALNGLPRIENHAWIDPHKQLRYLRDEYAPLAESFYRLSAPLSAAPLIDKPWRELRNEDLDQLAEQLLQHGPGALGAAADQQAPLSRASVLPAEENAVVLQPAAPPRTLRRAKTSLPVDR